MRGMAIVIMLLFWPGVASATLTKQQLDQVVLAPPLNARAPLDLVFHTLDGGTVTLGEAIDGKASLLLPVDFNCRETCGPALAIATAALRGADLAQSDYRVIVVGVDAREGIDDARRFLEAQGEPGQAAVLVGDEAGLARLTQAIGYRFVRDFDNGVIAHPAGLVTLTADGRVSRSLSSLALTSSDLRLALIEAGEGAIGGVIGRLSLLCYGFDAAHGVYTARVETALRIAGGATVALMGVGLALLMRLAAGARWR